MRQAHNLRQAVRNAGMSAEEARAGALNMLDLMHNARTSVRLPDGGVATVREPTMQDRETLAIRDVRENPRPGAVVGQVQQEVTIRPPYSEAPYEIVQHGTDGWWILNRHITVGEAAMAAGTQMYDTHQEAMETLGRLQAQWSHDNTRVVPVPEPDPIVQIPTYEIIQAVDGDGNDITNEITPELRTQVAEMVARDAMRRTEAQLMENLMQPNALLDSLPMTGRPQANEPTIQWPMEDTPAVEPTTEDAVRETWGVVPHDRGGRTSYMILHGGEPFAGPFRREDHAVAVMRACIYAPERLDPPTSHQKKGRALDVTTSGEVALQQRIKDLEWVIADLLAPVTPGREVHPGHRMIQGWYYPERLEAARRVVNTGESSSGVYSKTEGDIPGGNKGGRRRGMRIPD